MSYLCHICLLQDSMREIRWSNNLKLDCTLKLRRRNESTIKPICNANKTSSTVDETYSMSFMYVSESLLLSSTEGDPTAPVSKIEFTFP